MAGTKRQRALREAIRALVPHAPLADAEPIYQAALSAPTLRHLPPTVAAWLATTTHVRHRHTDYDALLAEGYDRDAARFFVAEAINEVLTRWGAGRLVDPAEESDVLADERSPP